HYLHDVRLQPNAEAERSGDCDGRYGSRLGRPPLRRGWGGQGWGLLRNFPALYPRWRRRRGQWLWSARTLSTDDIAGPIRRNLGAVVRRARGRPTPCVPQHWELDRPRRPRLHAAADGSGGGPQRTQKLPTASPPP